MRLDSWARWCQCSRYGEAEAVAGREGSVFRLAQMVAAMPSIFGGTSEIMKTIIARDLTGLRA